MSVEETWKTTEGGGVGRNEGERRDRSEALPADGTSREGRRRNVEQQEPHKRYIFDVVCMQ